MCAARQVKSADDLSSVVRQGKLQLLCMNPFWEFEHSLLLSLCGATAESRAAAHILGQLPTGERHIKLSVVKTNLELLQSSDCMKLSPVSVQLFCCVYIENNQRLYFGCLIMLLRIVF